MPFLLMLKLQFGQSLPNFHMLVYSSIYIFFDLFVIGFALD